MDLEILPSPQIEASRRQRSADDRNTCLQVLHQFDVHTGAGHRRVHGDARPIQVRPDIWNVGVQFCAGSFGNERTKGLRGLASHDIENRGGEAFAHSGPHLCGEPFQGGSVGDHVQGAQEQHSRFTGSADVTVPPHALQVGVERKGRHMQHPVGACFAALGGVVRRNVRHRRHSSRSIKCSFVSRDTPCFPSHDPLARSAQSSSQTAMVITLAVVLPQNHRQLQGGSDLLADDPGLVGEGDHSRRLRCELPNSLSELGRVGPRGNDVRVPGVRQPERRKPAPRLDHRGRADDLRIRGKIKLSSGWHDQNGEPTSTVRCSDETEMFALTSSAGRQKIRISHDNPTLRVFDRLVSIRRHVADNATPGASPSRMPLPETKARSQRPCL